jgi:hypothetical protein
VSESLESKACPKLRNKLNAGEIAMVPRFGRFWIPAILACLTGILTLITPIFPDWIEVISGWDPDQHDGSVESMIVIALFIVTAWLMGLAVVEWRRTAATTSA